MFMGKASNVNSLRENCKFFMSLQGLDCLQLNIMYMPKWQIWERPVLNPYGSRHRLNWDALEQIPQLIPWGPLKLGCAKIREEAWVFLPSLTSHCMQAALRRGHGLEPSAEGS